MVWKAIGKQKKIQNIFSEFYNTFRDSYKSQTLNKMA